MSVQQPDDTFDRAAGGLGHRTPGPTTSDRLIGHRLFLDGVTRPVSLDAAGKQYVVGTDGEAVPGVWVLPPVVPSDPPTATLETTPSAARPPDQTNSTPRGVEQRGYRIDFRRPHESAGDGGGRPCILDGETFRPGPRSPS